MAAYHPRYKFTIYTHHPVGREQDCLNYRSIAQAISEILANTTRENAGVTIGVFGGWGIGKSSVLRMVREELLDSPTSSSNKNEREEFQPLVVTFEAWRYLRQEDLWLALLRKIVRQVEATEGVWALIRLNWLMWKKRIQNSPIFWSSVFQIIAKSALVGAVLFLTLWGATALLLPSPPQSAWLAGKKIIIAAMGGAIPLLTKITISGWKTIGEIFQGKLNIALPPLSFAGYDRGQEISIDIFLTDFKAVLTYFEKRQHPLVVLIDDLDRCPVDQIVPLLEAMKHLSSAFLELDQETGNKKPAEQRFSPISFVLAVDRQVLERAVRAHFKDYQAEMTEEERKSFTREYIEKIVQIPLYLPPLKHSHLLKMLDGRC